LVVRIPGRRFRVRLALVGLVGILGLVPVAFAADPATERLLASDEILHEGWVGDLVADLQAALAVVGQDPGPIDGVFGPRTAAAVREFQTSSGIAADGIVGPQTRAAVAEAVEPGTTTTTTAGRSGLVPGDHGDAVAALQAELARASLYRGPIDGDFGPLTGSAVMAFHKTRGTERTAEWSSGDWSQIEGWRPTAPGYGSAASRIEVDLARQILFFIADGDVVAVMPVSSGSGEYYTSATGAWVQARTPEGDFAFIRSVDGWDRAFLGNLYEPWYFYGGYAVHGSLSVPSYPASHGCIRVSIADAEWLDARLWIGMPIHVRG
jgi:N-acetylmuramoyl-L-alanine amidase